MLLSKQKGVFRVNCIDCLDRTNVVQVSRRSHCCPPFSHPPQSAFARHVMGMQLEAVGLLNPPQSGKSGVEVIFNDGQWLSFFLLAEIWRIGTVWANNGDAISRA